MKINEVVIDNHLAVLHSPRDIPLTEHCVFIIDEPVSPSVDREAAAIPPSAVISVAQSITTGPSSPGSPCPPIRRQLSHDQGKHHWIGWEVDMSVRLERNHFKTNFRLFLLFLENKLNDNILI